jgi:hypothetical protein
MSDESSGRKRVLKPLEEPVYTHNGKWWFRDANDRRVGPYDTQHAARRRLEQYLGNAP